MGGMTLDEAIKHCEEVAEENDLAAGMYKILAENNHNTYEKLTAETNSSRCAECAEEHRQLAEWLRELKERREADNWISVNDRLPKKGTEVITCSFGSDIVVQEVGETLEEAISKTQKISKVGAGFYGSDGWYTIEGYPMIITPKFWQPLPEPPKIGGADNENT